jgi:quercetin dioxygenase-like cupin family protein
MSEQNQRLRPHPEVRFHPPQIQFDIERVAAKLLAEPLPANRLHRQETLYRHGSLTLALFLFEQGASLPQHTADGVVTVQVLQGRLKMSAEGKDHDLPAGSVLVLAPGVRHDVQAVEASRMLLTVCLDRNDPDVNVRQP